MQPADVRQKRTKLPAATARSAAFESFQPADAAVPQLHSELNPFVGLFRPSLISQLVDSRDDL